MEVDKKHVAAVKGQLSKAEKAVAGFKIKTQADYETAADKFVALKQAQKEFEKEKREWLDPLNKVRDKIFAVTRPIEARFKEMLSGLDADMEAWEIKQEAKRAAETDKLEDQVKSGSLSLADAADQAGKLDGLKPVDTAKGKMSKRTNYELVVTDVTKLPHIVKIPGGSILPILMPNTAAIKEYYQATGQLLPGVELKTKSVRTTRTR
jgi:Cu/Ag efflux pump CusA